MATVSTALSARRAAYAREVTARFGVRDPWLETAFARVPREAFLGPPPWYLLGRGITGARATEDPMDLYDDVLVVLDTVRGINNGQPSLHAISLEALSLTPRDHAIHVGAGTGYYTAIMAERAASVDAYEIEADLADESRVNLAPWRNVRVFAESATGRTLAAADAIYVSAGAAAPDPAWLDALTEGGRLVFPLTVEERWGAMLRVERRGAGFAARFILDCGFIPCTGARDPAHDKALSEALTIRDRAAVRSLTRIRPDDAALWYAGDGWFLSTEPPA
jgi:protein-L-isoaspartate(D-aspartate) O-methyltransferase